jgi:hypothetical protein
MYLVHVNKILKLLFVFMFMGILIACSGDDDEDNNAASGLEAESVLTVTSTTPSNGSLGVPRDVQISVTFSEDVDPRTITDSSFTLSTNDVLLHGTITWLGNVVTYTPAFPLAPDKTYTGMVTTVVRDSQENPLASDFIWSFTTSSALSPDSPGQIDGKD